MSGIFHEGKWYENTDQICARCGRPVYESDLPHEYAYQCFYCDEDLYGFETEEQDAHFLPSVMVARPFDGITINTEIEYLLNGDGEPLVFANQPLAECFLLSNGYVPEDLEFFYYVEKRGKE